MSEVAIAAECLQAFRDRTGDEDDVVGARLVARFLWQIDSFLNS